MVTRQPRTSRSMVAVRPAPSDDEVDEAELRPLPLDEERTRTEPCKVPLACEARATACGPERFIARNAGTAASRMMLLEQVWSYRFDPRTKVLQTHLSRLRVKLNEGGRPDLIETVRNGG